MAKGNPGSSSPDLPIVAPSAMVYCEQDWIGVGSDSVVDADEDANNLVLRQYVAKTGYMIAQTISRCKKNIQNNCKKVDNKFDRE